MRMCFRNNLRRTLKDFRNDQSGIALIYVTAALPVLVGLSLLAIDVGRLSSLQSSLQHGADALALAGAGELDRRPDAIERANLAIANLITTNTSLFATSVVTIDENAVSVRYLATIPGHGESGTDADPITGAALDVAVAADNQLARFVEVTVTPVNFNTIFPVTFLGGASNSAQSSAEAVAGFTAAVCKFTPVLMCNPFEPDDAPLDEPNDVYKDYGLYAHVKQESFRRRLIELKSQDNQWEPGNFGFLEPYSGNGTQELAKSIASVSPQACIVLDNISLNTAPGNRQVLMKAFNVRFALYPNGQIGGEAAMSYPPAKNVRKGYIVKKTSGAGTPDACNPNDNNPVSAYTATGLPDYTVAMGLPKDACHVTGTCTAVDGRLGDGDWGGDNPLDLADLPQITDFYQYWRFNHPDHPTIPSEQDLDVDVDGDGIIEATPVANDNPPSRYSVYRYEIAQGWHNDLNDNDPATPPLDLPEKEVQTQCNAGAAIDSPDRRIIYGALMNCRANGLSGGKNTGLIALAFAKFFVTQPMVADNPDAAVLYTELIDVVQPGDANAVARDIVQLYR